jgi:HAD superfamily hydrolase (TIGR01490 family)
MRTELAIYDMDRTITRRATYTHFLLHAARRLAPWRLALLPAAGLLALAYLLRLVGRAKLKELNYRLLVGRGVAPERLEPVVESFAEATLRANVLPGALERIAADRAEGRRLVMATASYALYAGAIGRKLGFDDVVATRTGVDARGRVVARIDGANCYGLAKRDMVEAWLQGQGLEREAVHVRFYSDHVSDRPAFEWADEPVAVNPHGKLRRLAEHRGWAIEDWG